jgi:hypothetical protein
MFAGLKVHNYAQEVMAGERWHGTLSGYDHHRCRCDQCRQARKQYRKELREREDKADAPWHGKLTGYYDHRCRCDACKEEARAYRQSRQKGSYDGSEAWHGTHGGYNERGCRCERCSEAESQYRQGLKARPQDGSEPWHGTYSGYHNQGCRCDLCKQAERDERKRLRVSLAGDESWHGKLSGYTYYGCRCENCVQAWDRYYEQNRERIIASARQYREENPGRPHYGLTREVAHTWRQANPMCELCSEKPAKALDHDHSCSCAPGGGKCGKCVRGHVCLSCNRLLGVTKDDAHRFPPELRERAQRYLDAYQERREAISDS